MTFCNLHRNDAYRNISRSQQEKITYSMSFSLIMANCGHNIIQIETNIRIEEEKQKYQIKKSNSSYRDLNFFSDDISRASIDAELLNTSWDMLLTDVKTDEMYKIIINICLGICKKHLPPKKSPRKHQTPRDRRALMRKR